jgi:hypothetical protein
MSAAELKSKLEAQEAKAARLNPHGPEYRHQMHEVNHTRRLLTEAENEISTHK